MAQSDWSRDHVRRYRASGGADGHMWKVRGAEGSFPCLLLTTTGRSSGKPRTTPLIYGRDGDDYLVVASQGGRPDHPSWYLNLVRDPKVEVQVKSDVFAVAARTAGAAERGRLWKIMTGIYPPYDDYQEKAAPTREIPVVVLSRA